MKTLNFISHDLGGKQNLNLKTDSSLLNNLNFLDMQKAEDIIKSLVRKRFIQKMQASKSKPTVEAFAEKAHKISVLIEAIFARNTIDHTASMEDITLIKSILMFEISIEKAMSHQNREKFNIEYFGQIYNFSNKESYEKQCIQNAKEIEAALEIFEELTTKPST